MQVVNNHGQYQSNNDIFIKIDLETGRYIG